MRASLPLFVLVMATTPALAQSPITAASETRMPQISVVGEGEARARPDLATVLLGVMREAKTAREALDANNKAMADVTAAMKAEGIEDRDLQTSNLSIQPRYNYSNNGEGNQQPELIGYQVVNTLSVRVRDISKVGALLDKAVELGVNQGGQINFDVADNTAALAQARKRAVEDAVARAKTLAEAAGVALGSVMEISESATHQPPMPMMAKSFEARAADSSSVPVEAGENAYRVQVNVTFAIDR